MPRNKYNIALIISYSNSYQPRGSLGNEIALLVHLNAEPVQYCLTWDEHPEELHFTIDVPVYFYMYRTISQCFAP